MSARRSPVSRWLITACAALAVLPVAPLMADQPGRGQTATFEIEFLRFTMDHHFAALRMTELAAGTDPRRDEGITANEGTSPTPGFAASSAKATLDDLKSLARRNNRMQREEIGTLRRMLRDWYGLDHEPRVRGDARASIDLLERAAPGASFNHTFYEVFSRHHYGLLEPLNACLTGTEIKHEDLRRECRTMWHSQTADIDMMRRDLLRHFGIADYQPFEPRQPFHGSGRPRGGHGGGEPSVR